MSANNRSAHPLFIIAGTLVCLLALSAVNNSFSWQGLTFRNVDMIADIKRDHPAPVIPAPPVEQNAVAAAATPADSTATPVPAQPVYDFMSYTGIQEYNDTISPPGMQRFIAALQELRKGKRKKVRIAYFGDSMIEGDLITGDLRDSLQSQFGGAGVGFVPVTSVVASFRTTIQHTFSDNWKDYHFKNSPPKDLPLGLSGHTFVPDTESWARYSPVRRRRLDRFDEVYLFYGPAAGNNIVINGRPYTLSGIDPVNELAFRQDTLQRSVLLKYNGGTAPPPFYGLSFESDSGIYVDNYSFRGISGIELGKLGKRMMQQMQRRHPYDLVVLHYGANVLFRPELTDYSWYERPMQRVMDSLRNNWPQTSFLIIGTADKAYKKTDRYVTAPGVPALLKVQHELAQEYGTAYWNLYAAMGGEGSMTHWVEGDTVLANRDYTHFNRQGASRVGALLYKAIMDEFKQEVHP